MLATLAGRGAAAAAAGAGAGGGGEGEGECRGGKRLYTIGKGSGYKVIYI
jgi:hypothetical protein